MPHDVGMREPPPISPPMQIHLTVLPDAPCPYLPDRVQTLRAVNASSIDGQTYLAFMNAGFRRSGRMIYQNVCRGCRECIPLRVPVATFEPSSSQRRTYRRNSDLRLEVAAPQASDEKFELYGRYVSQWHNRAEEAERQSFELFLYDSPTETLEFTYRDGDGRLMAVGICDISRQSLSSVYFYFDPAEAKRSLGTYGALREIDFCREHRIAYYYLGFWVRDCVAMTYKANFRPYELLDQAGRWTAPLSNP